MKDTTFPTRRALVAGALGGAAATALPAAAPARDATPFTAAAVEGPYYLDVARMRAEIAEGRPGVSLEIAFAIRDQAGAPFEGARVDVWHCDALGRYSGFPGQGDDGKLDLRGETFLRGTQLADAEGRVGFASVYPGWYPGRTAHVHFKVIDGSTTRLTSQFFLPDAVSEYLYLNVSAYRRGQLRDTLNATDGIALAAGETVHGELREIARGYRAFLEVKVDRTTTRSAEMRGFGGPPGGSVLPPGLPFGGPPRRPPLEGAERVRAIAPSAG